MLFDIDGTLTHSDHLHFDVFQSFLKEKGFNGGIPIDETFFKTRISGGHNPDIFLDLFPELPESARDAMIEEKEARFRAMAAEQLEPLKGLPRLCDLLRSRGIRRAAVTNAPRANAELMIRAVGLDGFFEELIIGAECVRAKPDPEPYLEGLRRLGCAAEDAIAFEDSPSGMRAAAAAGLACFGVLTTQTRERLMEAGAVACIKDFDDEALWAALPAEDVAPSASSTW